MKLLEKIYSKQDKTIKYIFLLNTENIIELSYINNGKDIICVPTQTSCSVGCKFCHISDFRNVLKTKNIEDSHIVDGVKYVIEDLNLKDKLLISYMGCGEPLYNVDNVIESMVKLTETLKQPIRFGLATCIPESCFVDFYKLTELVKKNKLEVKIHLSLHYIDDCVRKQWMPNSLEIKPSLLALKTYKEVTGNLIEIHYVLIEDLNDQFLDALYLINFAKHIPIKFLFFNEKESLDYARSDEHKSNMFEILDEYNIQHEYYIPPGLDIGASCGQFTLDYYLKYNLK